MGRFLEGGLAGLQPEDIKELVLRPGTSPESIVRGCKLWEQDSYDVMNYRGLVIHRSPQGNQVTTVERVERNGERAILVHQINLRRYERGTGRINWGSRVKFYFPKDKEGYQIVDEKLKSLGL